MYVATVAILTLLSSYNIICCSFEVKSLNTSLGTENIVWQEVFMARENMVIRHPAL